VGSISDRINAMGRAERPSGSISSRLQRRLGISPPPDPIATASPDELAAAQDDVGAFLSTIGTSLSNIREHQIAGHHVGAYDPTGGPDLTPDELRRRQIAGELLKRGSIRDADLPTLSPPPSTTERLAHAGQSALHGAVSTIGSIPKGLAIGKTYLEGDATEATRRRREGIAAELNLDAPPEALNLPEANPLYRAGEAITGTAPMPDDPRMRGEFLAETLPLAAGSMAATMTTGGIGSAARLPSLLTMAGVGAAGEASGQYEQARAAGVDFDTAQKAAGLGGVVGTSEALPIERILNRATGGISKKILKDMIAGAVEEGLQEAGQQTAGNLIARRYYDPERPTFEGVAEGMAAGGIVGGAASGVAGMIGRARARREAAGQPGAQARLPGGAQPRITQAPVDPRRLPPDFIDAEFTVPEQPGPAGPTTDARRLLEFQQATADGPGPDVPGNVIPRPGPINLSPEQIEAGLRSGAIQDAAASTGGPEAQGSALTPAPAPLSAKTVERGRKLAEATGGKPEWYTTRKQITAGERQHGLLWDGATQTHKPIKTKTPEQLQEEAAERKKRRVDEGTALLPHMEWAITKAPPASRKGMEQVRDALQREGTEFFTREDVRREWYKGAAAYFDKTLKRAGWKLDHKSDSGSRYYTHPMEDVRLRVSDHELGYADYGSRKQSHRGPEVVLDSIKSEAELLDQVNAAIADYDLPGLEATPAIGQSIGDKIRAKRPKASLATEGGPAATPPPAPAPPASPSDVSPTPTGRPNVSIPTATPDTSPAHEAATSPLNDLPEPTPAQKEAGNYKKGHLRFGGLDISIENPIGSERKGVDKGGKPWSVPMTAHYGYIKRTEGHDGDQVDVYLPERPREDAPAVVFNQHDPKTGKFDEHKVVLGAASIDEAKRIYDAHFSDGSGPQRRASFSQMPLQEFKEGLKSGLFKKAPSGRANTTAVSQEPSNGSDQNETGGEEIIREGQADAGPQGQGQQEGLLTPARTEPAALPATAAQPESSPPAPYAPPLDRSLSDPWRWKLNDYVAEYRKQYFERNKDDLKGVSSDGDMVASSLAMNKGPDPYSHHKSEVKKAFKKGKTWGYDVHPDVLADYPELGPKTTEPANPDTPAPAITGFMDRVRDRSAQKVKDGEIYTINVKGRGQQFAVRDSINNPKGYGDVFFDTEAEALKERDLQTARRIDKQKSTERQEAEATKAAEAQAIKEDIDGFDAGMTPLQRGQAIAALNSPRRSKGKVVTVKDIVREAVAEGDRIITVGGEKALGDAVKGFRTQKQIGAIALKYAEYLINKGKPAESAKPLKMDGSTRPDKATPEDRPPLPQRSVDSFNEAIKTKDVAKLRQMVHPINKGWRKMFEAETGSKLPSGVKASEAAVEQWASEPAPTVDPDPDASVVDYERQFKGDLERSSKEQKSSKFIEDARPHNSTATDILVGDAAQIARDVERGRITAAKATELVQQAVSLGLIPNTTAMKITNTIARPVWKASDAELARVRKNVAENLRDTKDKPKPEPSPADDFPRMDLSGVREIEKRTFPETKASKKAAVDKRDLYSQIEARRNELSSEVTAAREAAKKGLKGNARSNAGEAAAQKVLHGDPVLKRLWAARAKAEDVYEQWSDAFNAFEKQQNADADALTEQLKEEYANLIGTKKWWELADHLLPQDLTQSEREIIAKARNSGGFLQSPPDDFKEILPKGFKEGTFKNTLGNWSYKSVHEKKPVMLGDAKMLKARAEANPPQWDTALVTSAGGATRSLHKGIALLKNFVKEVPEFAIDPAFEVTQDGDLRFEDGGTYIFKPAAIGVDLGEKPGDFVGQRIAINLDDLKVAKDQYLRPIPAGAYDKPTTVQDAVKRALVAMKGKAEKVKYTLANTDGDPTQAEGEKYGDVAVRKGTVKDNRGKDVTEYFIDHIQSGLRMDHFTSVADARAYAIRVSDIHDWASIEPGWKPTGDLLKKLQALSREPFDALDIGDQYESQAAPTGGATPDHDIADQGEAHRTQEDILRRAGFGPQPFGGFGMASRPVVYPFIINMAGKAKKAATDAGKRNKALHRILARQRGAIGEAHLDINAKARDLRGLQDWIKADPENAYRLNRAMVGQYAMNMLPKAAQAWVKQARTMHDAASRDLIDELIMANGGESKLTDSIRDNLGTYLAETLIPKSVSRKLREFATRKHKLRGEQFKFKRDKWAVKVGDTHFKFDTREEAHVFANDLINEAKGETIRKVARDRGVTPADLKKLAAAHRKIQVIKPIPEEQRREMFIRDPLVQWAVSYAKTRQNAANLRAFRMIDRKFGETAPAGMKEEEVETWAKDRGLAKVKGTKNTVGVLADKYVPKRIAAEINDMVRAVDRLERIWTTYLSFWKKSLTVWNPATHFRNIIGNAPFADFAGVDPLKPWNLPWYVRAGKEIKAQGDDYRFLVKQGVLGVEFYGNEVDQTTKLLEAESETAFDALIKAGRKVDAAMGAAYNVEDQIFKVAAYLKYRNRGIPRLKAARLVNHWFPNYAELFRTTKNLSRRFVGAPFLAFNEQAVRISGRAGVSHPIKLAKWAAMPGILSAMGLYLLGLDDDERDMVNRGRSYAEPILPGRDNKGAVRTLDLRYTIPLANEIHGLLGGERELALPGLLQQPIVGGVVDMSRNRDPRTGREIYRPDAPTSDKLAKSAWHILKGAAPLPSFARYGGKRIKEAAEGKGREGVFEALAGVFVGINARGGYVRRQDAYEQIRALAERDPNVDAFIRAAVGVKTPQMPYKKLEMDLSANRRFQHLLDLFNDAYRRETQDEIKPRGILSSIRARMRPTEKKAS